MFEYSLYFRLFVPKKGSLYAFSAGAFLGWFTQHFQSVAVSFILFYKDFQRMRVMPRI